MIDIEAIIAAAKALGGQVEDHPAHHEDTLKEHHFPEQFKTAAMAKVLAGQGLKGLTRTWRVVPTVVSPVEGIRLHLRAASCPDHATPVCINRIEGGGIECAWKLPEELSEALGPLMERMTIGVTVRCYDSDLRERLAHISPLPSSGALHLSGLPSFVMARASVYLEMAAQRWNLFSTERLYT